MGGKGFIIVLGCMKYYNSKKDNLDCLLEYTVSNDCLYYFLENLPYITPEMLHLTPFCPELTKFLIQPKVGISTSNNFKSEKLGIC